jgi:phosphoglycolate phosphatase
MLAYKHIIWDWNGTLFDDSWLCLDVMNNQLAQVGKPAITFDEYQRLFTFPVKLFYEKIGFDFSVHNWEKVAQSFIEEYTERRFECELQCGVPGILKKLATFGCEHSILSAYAESVLQEMVDHYNLKDFFTHIVGLNNHYASGKIDEGKILIQKMETPLKNIVLIGDTTHDYEVARELGIDCILINNGHHSADKLKECDTPLVSSFSEAMLHIVK